MTRRPDTSIISVVFLLYFVMIEEPKGIFLQMFWCKENCIEEMDEFVDFLGAL